MGILRRRGRDVEPPRPGLAFDGEPEVEHSSCECCGKAITTSTGFVLRDGRAFAAYWLAWYAHSNEGWLDAAIGTWDAPTYPGHVTFGCRIGAVEGQEAPACSLVAPSRKGDSPLLGRKLDREAALAHPWLGDFWALTDWVILNDPVAHANLFHFEP